MKTFLCQVMFGFVKLQGSDKTEHPGDDLEPAANPRLRTKGPGTGTTADWSFCSAGAPCGQGQGDCDGSNYCKPGHYCGNDNCVDYNKDAHILADCCVDPACKIYTGHYISGSSKANIQECANWCADTPVCQTWTFYSDTAKCWIKSSDGKKVCDDGSCDESPWVSGTKACGTNEGDCPNGWTLFESKSKSRGRGPSKERAPSAITNCGCQCSNLMCKDQDGKVHGNCKSANSGAQWCFVEAGTPCQDLQTSDTKDWSYEACATPSVC